MKERLKALRRTLKLNQQEFADKIGINRGTLANYEVGRNEPIDAVVKLICDTFHVSEPWLRSGSGEMFVDTSEYDEIKKMVDTMLHDESADIKRRLVAVILRMSPEHIRLVAEWAKEVAGLTEAPAVTTSRESSGTLDAESEAIIKAAGKEAEDRKRAELLDKAKAEDA